jgi:hypothetical protein
MSKQDFYASQWILNQVFDAETRSLRIAGMGGNGSGGALSSIGFTQKDSEGNILDFYSDKNLSSIIERNEDKLYTDVETGSNYKWNGSSYVLVSGSNLSLGDTEGTAFPGNRGKLLEEWRKNAIKIVKTTDLYECSVYQTVVCLNANSSVLLPKGNEGDFIRFIVGKGASLVLVSTDDFVGTEDEKHYKVEDELVEFTVLFDEHSKTWYTVSGNLEPMLVL